MKQVCIVGAGTAGLCAARRALENNFAVTVFEQTEQIGGTWIYTDQTGIDEYGLDIHSSMYQGLRTNLPKEIMGFSDFPIEGSEKSYISAQEVEHFLNSFAEKFQLEKHIRFLHYVIRIMPKRNDKWEVIVKDLKSGTVDFLIFDYVMICNGHYHTPLYPKIKGSESFAGKQIHSHDYKNNQIFEDESVLIIGTGPSGIDLCHEILKVAKKVSISHHKLATPSSVFSTNIDQKPDVSYIDGNNVYFTNDACDKYTIILYCTGYKYAYPFLSTDCGIHVDENYVQPLYKHCINIEYPTMALIGIPFYVCCAQMFDLQIRFAMKHWCGDKVFPKREQMMEETRAEMEARFASGHKKRLAHMMGKYQVSYYNDLAETADIENLKPVMIALYMVSSRRIVDDMLHFREDVYRILDDENFVQLNKKN